MPLLPSKPLLSLKLFKLSVPTCKVADKIKSVQSFKSVKSFLYFIAAQEENFKAPALNARPELPSAITIQPLPPPRFSLPSAPSRRLTFENH